MTPYTFALVGLRLIIVFLVLDSIATDLAWLLSSDFKYNTPVSWRDVAWSGIGHAGITLLIGAAFWLLTRRAAKFLVSGHEEGEGFGIEGKQLLAVLLAVIGAHQFIFTFPNLVVGVYRLMAAEPGLAPQAELLHVVQSGLGTLLALMFMFMGHRIVAWMSLFSRRKE